MSEINEAVAYLERWLPFWRERNPDSARHIEVAIEALRRAGAGRRGE